MTVLVCGFSVLEQKNVSVHLPGREPESAAASAQRVWMGQITSGLTPCEYLLP